MLAVWFSQQISKKSAQLLINLKEYDIIQKLINVIEFIESDERNMAKTIWALDVCKYSIANRGRIVDLIGSKFKNFTVYLKKLQTLEYYCDYTHCALHENPYHVIGEHILLKDGNDNF